MISTAQHMVAKPQREPRWKAAIRYALTHPLAMRVKRPLRDLAWTLRGGSVQNPPMPARVDSVVFVCLGNICRSPFAGLLAERILAEAGRHGVRVTSAGIRPSQANRSPVDACDAAGRYGLSLVEHVPQLLTRDMIVAHDMVVVMEAAQLAQMRRAYPEYHDRIFLLALYDEGARGACERYNIADPFGRPPSEFDACYTRIARALRRWASEVPSPGESSVKRQ